MDRFGSKRILVKVLNDYLRVNEEATGDGIYHYKKGDTPELTPTHFRLFESMGAVEVFKIGVVNVGCGKY